LPANTIQSNPDGSLCRHIPKEEIGLFPIIMAKSETLRRIDQSYAGNLLIDRDVIDPDIDTTPDVPSGVTVRAVQDGILINVDFNVDTAHNHPRFQAFIVYVRPVTDPPDDDSGMEVGRFSDNDWTWQQPTGGYTGWLIALSAVSNTGYESAKTDWYQCVLSTYYDDFSKYGGEHLSDQGALYWLKIADFDTDEDWTTGAPGASADGTYYVEGDRGIQFTFVSIS
jgi:hypothetical protein